MSKGIQNNILVAVSNIITHNIVEEIKTSNVYCIIVDEAWDTGYKKQMGICCGYLHKSQIKERFLGFVELTVYCRIIGKYDYKEFLASVGLNI